MEIGTSHDPVYFLVSGLALLCGLLPDGQQVTLDLLQVGDVYGLDQMDVTVGTTVLHVVVEGTVLYTLSQATLRHLVGTHPPLAHALLSQKARQLARAHQRVLELAACSVQVRLAHDLARVAVHGRVSGLSRDMLGMIVGASRQQVTKALDNLRVEGLIAYRAHQRDIILCDRELLARLNENPRQGAIVSSS
jgi:CRP-like cAMP-binding protein